jgi:hypothetical protein
MPSLDQVCLEKDMCTNPDFNFMLVLRQSGLDMLEVQGLIGLTPRHIEEDADLFIEELHGSGVIDS